MHKKILTKYGKRIPLIKKIDREYKKGLFKIKEFREMPEKVRLFEVKGRLIDKEKSLVTKNHVPVEIIRNHLCGLQDQDTLYYNKKWTPIEKEWIRSKYYATVHDDILFCGNINNRSELSTLSIITHEYVHWERYNEKKMKYKKTQDIFIEEFLAEYTARTTIKKIKDKFYIPNKEEIDFLVVDTIKRHKLDLTYKKAFPLIQNHIQIYCK
ncbi:MAG: hypothetical protein Dasosvirus20_1 [Dasosvirus sp.]|uniref:Uncharacterized protein n=1 Tax=Dasosvirus sp. TaxID=2487764 RepID=A0A3G4ZUH8_9VIRU|nr:MAG: hypothetical protein Dasosvirus20_1 [Dasosvirus sp.]